MNQIVVAGVEIEPGGDDVARRIERRLRLLDGADVRDLRQCRDRGRLGVDDGAAGNVVEDDRPVGGSGDRCDVRDDAALRRLVVVRRHDEKSVNPNLVGALGQVHGMGGVVRAGADDDRVRHRRSRRPPSRTPEPLVVGQRRRLTRRPGDDNAVGAVLDEEAAEPRKRVEIDRAVRPRTG